MKRAMIGIGLGVLLALSFVPQAQAAAFMTITVGAATVTCNNTAAACGGGFTSALGANTITFTGTVGGYTFNDVTLNSNQPGSAAVAFTLDTKTQVTHVSGADSATINYGVNGFTSPVGAGTLSASQSGTLTSGAAGGTETFRSWERNDNGLTAGPTGATAVSTTNPCTFAASAPPVQACSGPTLTIGSPLVAAPFALTSEEVITTPIGAITNWTGTTALTATVTPVIPEPSTVVLLGTGMLMVAGRQYRKRKK